MMTETTELKPCPFCGGPGKLSSYISGHCNPKLDMLYHYAECERCDITLGNEEVPEKAAQKWNHRALSTEDASV
jgi:Lar family restriction alleviation protein